MVGSVTSVTSGASERDERCVRSTEDTPEGDLHVVCRHVPRASLTTGFIFCVANLISEQLRPRRALDRGQVRVIVAHARRRGGVARVLCTHTASQHRAAAWRHSSPHLLALLATSSCIVWVSACCLGHRAPVMLLSCRSCSLTYAIALTLFIRCAGRSFIPRRITEGTPFGFRNVLVRARRKCLAALGPSVHHHVGIARRFELYALSLAGESGGNSPRLLVTGWLCYRRYYRGTPTTLSSWSPSPPPMPPPTPPPPGVVNLQTATGHSSLSSCAAGCRERCDIEETT